MKLTRKVGTFAKDEIAAMRDSSLPIAAPAQPAPGNREAVGARAGGDFATDPALKPTSARKTTKMHFRRLRKDLIKSEMLSPMARWNGLATTRRPWASKVGWKFTLLLDIPKTRITPCSICFSV